MTAPDISPEAVARLAFKAEIDAGYGHYCGPSVVADTLRALRAALTEAEAAQAAAQADFERRILACLTARKENE